MSYKSYTASSENKHKLHGVNGIRHQQIKIQEIFFNINFVSYLSARKIIRFQLILLHLEKINHLLSLGEET